jgi:hypothetical protein
MDRFLRKSWPFIIIWGIMGIYLVAAPSIYDHFFIREGKPVQVNSNLPIKVTESESWVDRLDVYNENDGIYQLFGWAFLTVDKNIPAGAYQRQVVLLTEKGNSVFAAASAWRTDVQLAYKNLGMDVNLSGISALINSNTLKSGIYRIGYIYKNTKSGNTYYIDTGRCLQRTVNEFSLEDPGSSICQLH